MTKVLVHGNPESAEVWDPLIAELHIRGVDDVVTVSPPGFGVPAPDGWRATPGAYVQWLHDELASMDGPIDLLGHDWGAGHVLGLAAEHPGSIRSWSIDVAGIVHPDYQWHDAAQGFQTPEVGEEMVARMLGMEPSERAAIYVGLGVGPAVAEAMAAAFTADMGRCVLELYRAAAQPFMAELGTHVAAADRRPSLILDATDDAYVPSSLTNDVAERFGSNIHRLDGQGHWWMFSAPDRAADGLVEFWAGLPDEA
jgi:pimeloyl-ACP methyl ester carboxylesterase